MADEELLHYGTPHAGATPHSGRYKYGSGERPNQHGTDLLSEVARLRKKGLTEAQIASDLGMTTTQLRARKSIAKAQERQALVNRIEKMRDEGMSPTAIGKELGINESSVRSYLSPAIKAKQEATFKTANVLKEEVDKHQFIDIGRGVENHMGVSADKLKTSVEMLKEDGYKVMYVKTEQLGTGNNTSIKVLVPPGMDYPTLAANAHKIRTPGQMTDDGVTFQKIPRPVSFDSKRVAVRYAEQGGTDRDGVLEIRPGVSDISLGKSSYAQVRVLVDKTHYLKGVAMYADDLPPGVDIRFNTNKSNTGNKKDALKPIKDDPDNPFGSSTRPHFYIDPKTGKKKQSVMNIVNEEGTWDTWSKNLPSQFLSKQRPSLAKEQLSKSTKKRKAEFDEIMSLTNPVVKKQLLLDFAESCDSAAVHLKAAALPRQATHVILPAPFMKDAEIYAPKYKNGEKVALVRFPHGGTFEIPELTVNNRQPRARKLFGELRDAVGIHPRVAERLSGADFDGDTVLVLPNNSGKVKSTPALKGLEGFDPKAQYKLPPGAKKMSSRKKGQEMGNVSNLITDMTIKGATASEIARAVRHSMVVIDAEKHGLDWKQSEIDHGIKQLKKKYQGKENAGAATLLSRSTSQQHVPDRKPRPAAEGGSIDPKTGKKVYVNTGATKMRPVKDKKGNIVDWEPQLKTIKSKKGAETDDAYTLSSGTKIEAIYADYSNGLKAMGNSARKAALATKPREYSPSARKVYADQYASLQAKLNAAKKNAPLERRAQLVANAQVRLKLEANPDMDSDHIKKLKSQAITAARVSTGAQKHRVTFTPLEWEAVQNGAISSTMLKDLLANADMDSVRQLALPKKQPSMSPGKVSRARAMLRNGATQAEIAQALGISTSTLNAALNGK